METLETSYRDDYRRDLEIPAGRYEINLEIRKAIFLIIDRCLFKKDMFFPLPISIDYLASFLPIVARELPKS